MTRPGGWRTSQCPRRAGPGQGDPARFTGPPNSFGSDVRHSRGAHRPRTECGQFSSWSPIRPPISSGTALAPSHLGQPRLAKPFAGTNRRLACPESRPPVLSPCQGLCPIRPDRALSPFAAVAISVEVHPHATAFRRSRHAGRFMLQAILANPDLRPPGIPTVRTRSLMRRFRPAGTGATTARTFECGALTPADRAFDAIPARDRAA